MSKRIFLGVALTFLMASVLFHIFPCVTRGFVGQIKIGVIGPQALPFWSPAGMKEASEMARDEINATGGIHLSSGDYELVLVFGNDHNYPTPDPVRAREEMERLIVVEGCSFIIGGSQSDDPNCLLEMIEVAADYAIPFFIIGSYDDDFINDTVRTDYARYKYLFRTNPTNFTTQLRNLFAFCQFTLSQELLPLYGEYLWPGAPNKQVRVAVLVEDDSWNLDLFSYLTDPAIYPSILGPIANVSYAGRIPYGSTDCNPWLGEVDARKCRLLINILYGVSGLYLSAQWGYSKVGAVPIGINMFSQWQDVWNLTMGLCEFGSILNVAGTRTPIVPNVTTTFWDNFVNKTGESPTYTAWGAYDTIYTLVEALETTGSTDKDGLVAHFENPSYERTGLRGTFKFTSHHDVFSNEFGPFWTHGYVRPFITQWQDGKLQVVWPLDQNYSKQFLLPFWMRENTYETPIKGGENATIRTNANITKVVVTKNALRFDASGPSGSTGWINMTFPMVNTTDIKVFINKQRLIPPPYPIITSNGTHYFIYFEFTLSTHEIAVQYDPPGVAITDVTPSKTVVCQNHSMFINVTLENLGVHAGTCNLTLYANQSALKTFDNISLAAGNSTTVTFMWNTTGMAKGNYTLIAYTRAVLNETDISEHISTSESVTVTMVGDITGPTGWPDGTCNMRDVGLVARYFGQNVPPAPPNCDLTGETPGVPDGIINMRDVGLVARHFGETDP